LGIDFIFFLIKHYVFERKKIEDAWEVIAPFLVIFQTAAILEIIHPILGLVRTDIITTLTQVFSRVLLTLGIAAVVPDAQKSFYLSTMVISWAITEVIRYSYYAVNQIAPVPYFLIWLRYSLFYILYPTGAGSEAALICVSFAYIREHKLWNIDLPNSHNFAFNYYYTLLVIVTFYIPILYVMMSHMHTQRKKYLSPQKTKTA